MDPEQVRLVPDVMVGVIELARVLVGEDRSVAFATPAYRPFLADLPASGLSVRQVPLRADGSLDLDRLRMEFVHGTQVFLLANHVPWLEVSPAARSCGFALTAASKAFNLAGLKAALLVTASDRTRVAADRLPSLAERAGLLGVIPPLRQGRTRPRHELRTLGSRTRATQLRHQRRARHRHGAAHGPCGRRHAALTGHGPGWTRRERSALLPEGR